MNTWEHIHTSDIYLSVEFVPVYTHKTSTKMNKRMQIAAIESCRVPSFLYIHESWL